jgi:hypothetical protein
MPQQQAEYMTCTPLRDKRQIPLAPRAPSIHEPVEGCAADATFMVRQAYHEGRSS